jgi:hypothetical protein
MPGVRTIMNTQLIRMIRTLHLLAGISVFLIGLFVWLFLILTTPAEPLWNEAMLLLMIVAPGFFFVLGCYLQAIWIQPWAALLVLISGGFHLRFVLAGCFLIAYIGNHFGIGLFWADFIIVLCTIVMGFLVALIDVVQAHLARVSGIEVTK